MDLTQGNVFSVFYFRQPSGNEPVKDWIRSFDKDDRKLIGEDIETAQLRWPCAMPIVKKIDTDLWEIRSTISHNQRARIFVTVFDRNIVLLHGFIKKTSKIPLSDLNLAKRRRDLVQRDNHEQVYR
ncbi:MAG: type II toxin-antitoxin system RelE/ParE family toxin [Gammaproteobacteria bacterium]|nr:type II toxin-antitoxin system RelE/ParE family toxin [Gammaproteobacteria bacterium]MDP2140477.1 type II toxin-antitoxin system RelE/ParE family toxin [Gammaproteobacteria bacterium]MDP2349516.1 type II toxin-antitoxin system RelE/ParE family toxin [Gammaproteobacteria bacterium]